MQHIGSIGTAANARNTSGSIAREFRASFPKLALCVESNFGRGHFYAVKRPRAIAQGLAENIALHHRAATNLDEILSAVPQLVSLDSSHLRHC